MLQRDHSLLPTERREAAIRKLTLLLMTCIVMSVCRCRLLLTFRCIVLVSDTFVIDSYLFYRKGIILALFIIALINYGQCDEGTSFAYPRSRGVTQAKAKWGPRPRGQDQATAREHHAFVPLMRTFVSADPSWIEHKPS